MPEFTGWLLDLFEDPRDGLVLYFIDQNGERRRLTCAFPVTFYALGTDAQLETLSQHLRNHFRELVVGYAQQMDVFKRRKVTVLAVTVANPYEVSRVFSQVAARFPSLEYANADVQISLRFAAQTGAFPLACCRVGMNDSQQLTEIEVLEDAWVMQPRTIPLRTLSLTPDVDPNHARPTVLLVESEGRTYRLDLRTWRPLLVNLRTLIRRCDPDLVLTDWGDTWLLPLLLNKSEQYHIPLELNRETGRGVRWMKERTYFSYGRIVYRGQQIHLFGRCHIDRRNAVLWNDYEYAGTLEACRVTSLPLQTSSRTSPGTGISSIEMLTALREGILVPWQKQETEMLKPAADLFAADQGGLVYQPRIGVHREVAEIDFISLYPAIMVYFNISPETILPEAEAGNLVPALGLAIDPSLVGLVPKALRPLLEKRVQMKRDMGNIPDWDPRRKSLERRASALKWLLVTCFGYLGYKNARFGRIEAHQAVTAYGREALLRAKEAAEDLGFEVIQLYVDGLWVSRPEGATRENVEPLLLEIQDRTGLPIALDGIYRWVVFVGSRQNKDRPVANRYFGVFQDGSIKVRGIDARRRDSAPFVSAAQMHLLELLAAKPMPEEALPETFDYLADRLRDLREGRVPLPDLIVRLQLSRKLEAYRTASPAARAALQLKMVGKEVRPGQRVALIYTRDEARVFAWDLPQKLNPRTVDVDRYQKLLLRAAGLVLESWGWDDERLKRKMATDLGQMRLPMPLRKHPANHRLSRPGSGMRLLNPPPTS